MGTPVTETLITFGSATSDYADWFEMIDALQTDPGDRQIILSDDLTLRNEGSHTTTAIAGSSALAVKFNGYTLTIESTVSPTGSPGVGNVITNNQNATMFSIYATDSTGTIIIKDQYVRQESAAVGYHFANVIGSPVWSTTYNISVTIQNCIHDANNLASGFFYATNISNSGTPTAKMILKSCKGWDYKYNVAAYGGDYLDAVVNSFSTNEEIILEHMTFHGDQKYFIRSSSLTMRNTVCVVSGEHTVACIQTATKDGGNATTDTTGDTGLTEITPANEFASLVDTESDFLFPKSVTLGVSGSATPSSGNAPLEVAMAATPSYSFGSANIADGGVAPVYTTHDIAGKGIPGIGGAYPIGCHVATVG